MSSSGGNGWNECGICYEAYSFERKDDAMKTPMIGSCGHSFCQLCLVKEHASKANSRRKHIECFICKENKAFHIDKLTPNKSLCDAIEIFMRISSGTSASKKDSSAISTTMNMDAAGPDNGNSGGDVSGGIKTRSETNTTHIKEDIKGAVDEPLRPELLPDINSTKEEESTKKELALDTIPMNNHGTIQRADGTSRQNDKTSSSSTASARTPAEAKNGIKSSIAWNGRTDQSALRPDDQLDSGVHLRSPKSTDKVSPKSDPAEEEKSDTKILETSIESAPSSPRSLMPKTEDATSPNSEIHGHNTKKRKATTTEEAQSGFKNGTQIRKHFAGHGTFTGRVVGFHSRKAVYQIKYDDGDKEEMTFKEVLNYHNIYNNYAEKLTAKKGSKFELVGSRILKHFAGHGAFHGRVVSYDPSNSYYRVIYSDGDKEDMILEQVLQCMLTSNDKTAEEDVFIEHANSTDISEDSNPQTTFGTHGKDHMNISQSKRKADDSLSGRASKRKATALKERDLPTTNDTIRTTVEGLLLERTRLFANGLQRLVPKSNTRDSVVSFKNEKKQPKSSTTITLDEGEGKIQNELDHRNLVQSELGIEIGKTTIRKYFPGHGDYNGKIVHFDPEERLYRVKYDDGDEEQMTVGEVRRHAAIYGIHQKRRHQHSTGSESQNYSKKGTTTISNPLSAMAVMKVDGGDQALKEEESIEQMTNDGETGHELGLLHEKTSSVEAPEGLSSGKTGIPHNAGSFAKGHQSVRIPINKVDSTGKGHTEASSVRIEINGSNTPSQKDLYQPKELQNTWKLSGERRGELDKVNKEPESDTGKSDALVANVIVQTSSAAGPSVRIPIEHHGASDNEILPIVKKEVGDYIKRNIKMDRMYGNRVLLARQAKNGMLKLGGGNCGMDMYPSLKNVNHPRFLELGFTAAIAYCDSWQPDGPKYAGQKYAHVGYLPIVHEPFSVFMKRSMKTKLLGWEYCGEYEAEDPENEIETWVRAHTLETHDRRVVAQSLLTTKGGRHALQRWRVKLTDELKKDASPASMAPEWLRERRRPTAAETEREGRIVPRAARARALGFEENLSDEKLASLLLWLDEFRTSKPIRFVRYDEKVYNYVKDGETTKNAMGKKRGDGENCAKASDWYAYWDQQVR